MKPDNYLRYWREKSGFTQDDLAKKAELSINTVARLESGSRKGYAETWEKLSGILGVSIEELKHGPKETAIQNEITYLGPVTVTETIPLLTSIPAGPWKYWIDSYPAGIGEGTVSRGDIRGEYVFAVKVEGDSMVPDLYPGDILVINPEKAFEKFHGAYAVVKFNGGFKVRNIWKRGDNYLLEPSNKAYESELVPITGTTIYKIVEVRKREGDRF